MNSSSPARGEFDNGVWHYATHLRDKVRVEAYIAALERVMFPGAVVVDLGAGTGFFSLLACKMGASRVYAIEPWAVIRLLKQQAVDNGCDDRITVFQNMSFAINLPEKADILISDLRGGLGPLFKQHILTLHDARQRFLKPDGVIIPERDVLHVALVQDEAFYQKNVAKPWLQNDYDVDMSSIFRYAVNHPFRWLPKPEQIISPPQLWTELRYGERSDPSARSTISWTMENEGIIHFILVWFDAILAPGVSYTTSPFVAEADRSKSYGGIYLPLEQPISILPGDEVRIELQAHYNPIRKDYMFIWNTQVIGAADRKEKATFKQSSFFSEPFSLEGFPNMQSDQ